MGKKWNYVNYRLCDTCGDPIRPHHLCLNCNKKQDGTVPHFDPKFGKTELEKKEEKLKIELEQKARETNPYADHDDWFAYRTKNTSVVVDQKRKSAFSQQNQRRQKAKRIQLIKKR